MRRRAFITFLGGAAVASPLVTKAQQPAMPVIGYLSNRSAESDVAMLVAFRRGPGEFGYIEGRNVYRLPALTAELTRQQVGSCPFWRRTHVAGAIAKLANPDCGQHWRTGLVASFNRPGGNMTGIATFSCQLFGKRLGFLLELVPDAKTVAFLSNDGPLSEADAREVMAKLGQQLIVLNASNDSVSLTRPLPR
jgi:putative ABC transport system substrate-binding protein